MPELNQASSKFQSSVNDFKNRLELLQSGKSEEAFSPKPIDKSPSSSSEEELLHSGSDLPAPDFPEEQTLPAASNEPIAQQTIQSLIEQTRITGEPRHQELDCSEEGLKLLEGGGMHLTVQSSIFNQKTESLQPAQHHQTARPKQMQNRQEYLF